MFFNEWVPAYNLTWGGNDSHERYKKNSRVPHGLSLSTLAPQLVERILLDHWEPLIPWFIICDGESIKWRRMLSLFITHGKGRLEGREKTRGKISPALLLVQRWEMPNGRGFHRSHDAANQSRRRTHWKSLTKWDRLGRPLTSWGADVIRSRALGCCVRKGRSGSVAAIVEAERSSRIGRGWRISRSGGGHCRRQRGAVVVIRRGRFRLTLNDPLTVVENQPAGRHRRLHGDGIEQRIVAAQIKRQTIDFAAAARMMATFLLLLLLMLLLVVMLLRRSQSSRRKCTRMKRFQSVLFARGQRPEGARTKWQSRIQRRMEKRILQMKKWPRQSVMMGSRCGGGCSCGSLRWTQSSQRSSRKRII